MNKNISKIFTVTLDNRVVAIETNLTDLTKVFKDFEPKGGAYITYFKKFKESSEFDQIIDGKVFHFQRFDY